MRAKPHQNPNILYPPVQQYPQQQHRVGDWRCVICFNINFAFRNECNRCGLISKEQNDHQNTMIAYGGGETCGLPYFLTPLRKKDKANAIERSPDAESHMEVKSGALLSVSPVLRQLGL